jgi:hypothetical protein
MTKIVLKLENIAQVVFFLRGEKVLLDADLAVLYGVTTKALNQAMRRNAPRFPEDFAFRLSRKEFDNMRSQIVTTSSEPSDMRSQIVTASPARSTMRSQIVTTSRRNVGALPFAFTEQGVAMLSSVLRSPRAVEVNIAIMRTFVQLRRLMDSNRDLARKIETLEKKYDEQFALVFEAIKQLVAEDTTRKAQPQRRIGFHPQNKT